MSNLYRIRPLEKKSMEYFVDVYEQLDDGTIRGFEVTETWRWGQAFRELDDPVYTCEQDRVHCRPEIGWGSELDDLCAVWVNFSEGFTEEEKAKIEAILRWESEDEDGRCGTGWLYDGDHNWQIEDDHVAVLGPVQVDLVDEATGEVIEENIALTELESGTDSTSWPFPTDKEDND